jgi:hypothetical protein
MAISQSVTCHHELFVEDLFLKRSGDCGAAISRGENKKNGET